MAALVAPAQWWLGCDSLGDCSPVVDVSALVAPAQWWLVCISLGGSSVSVCGVVCLSGDVINSCGLP